MPNSKRHGRDSRPPAFPRSKRALRPIRTFLLLAAAAFAAGGAFAQTPSPQLKKAIEQAEKEKTVRLVWGAEVLGGADGAQQIVGGTNKAFGTHLKAEFVPMSSMARVASQMITEASAGQPALTDLYLGTAAQITPTLSHFRSVGWSQLDPKRIGADIVEGGGVAVRAATGLPGADYNPTFAPKPPTRLEDFLAPQWKGRIASTPYGAGFDVLSANGVWGRERTFAFVHKLLPQLGGLMGCTEDERIATGEYAALVMNCLGEFAPLWKAKGAPVDRMVPVDAPARRYWYFAVPKNARSPNAAELVGVFMLSEAGQKLMWDLQRLDLDSLPGSRTKPLVASYEAKGLKFTDVTIGWWQQHPEIEPAVAQITKLLLAAKK